MNYSDFKGDKLSRLGFGAMRMPLVGRARGNVDFPKAEAIIDRLYESGVNYFDTAYMYHNGKSESVLMRALAKRPRESYFLADKLPWSALKTARAVKTAFATQLRRTGAGYFDYYLLHNVSGRTVEAFENEAVGAIPYLIKQREKGLIRHLGFSSHASPEQLDAFLSRHEGVFEFVQIQLNYLDWEIEAKAMYDVIVSHGLPVWVMEPVRGGRLASLTPEADAILHEAAPDRSVASWAFRWLAGLPEVKVILSGMSTTEQAEDNIATFAELSQLDAKERSALKKALSLLKGRGDIPCTRCRYCDKCPKALDIPWLLASYTELCIDGEDVVKRFEKVPEEKLPSACIACGKCAEVCPQGISIPEILAAFASELNKK